MPAPKRRHPPRPAPSEPLGAIVRDYEQWRRAQTGKPGKGAMRQYWQQRDRQYGQRPDYALWRQTQCPECPPERRQDPAELAKQALRSGDPQVYWAALAMLRSLPQPIKPPPGPAVLPQAPMTCALVQWLTADAPLRDLENLLGTAAPGWKPGRPADLSFLKEEKWLPISLTKFVSWVAAAVTRQARLDAGWMLAAWMMLRDLRAADTAARPAELEALLNAAQTARVTGDHHACVRLTALFVHLLPPQAPEALMQRARVAAWFLMENGMALPPGLKVSLDELPFPGEPPASEKGRDAARLFHDPADPWHEHFAHELAVDPEWQRLRTAGVVLHHPLAALAWIGKKAHSYAVKKQHDLLRSALTLAARHHLLGTTGRLLAQLQTSPEAVLRYANAMRESFRRMPFLRSRECWQEWTSHLRAAWSRLEADAIHETESVFFLHETLLDREVTTLRSLPQELRLLALRHLHSRRKPTALVQALEADPRLMQQLEHQRAVELWSIASFIRERPDQTATAWVSLVRRGDPDSGKYSLLVHGPAGQTRIQDRSKEGWTAVAEAIRKACQGAESFLVAADVEIDLTPQAAIIPSWEWAFRVLRESKATTGETGEILVPEGEPAPPVLPVPPAVRCELLAGPAAVNADTRWTAAGTGERRRSLSIGAQTVVTCRGTVERGPLESDLIRVCLAQATRSFVVVDPAGATQVFGLAPGQAKEGRKEPG